MKKNETKKIDSLIAKQSLLPNDVMPVLMTYEMANMISQSEDTVAVSACACSASCGSNFSRNGSCACSSSCGSNYSR